MIKAVTRIKFTVSGTPCKFTPALGTNSVEIATNSRKPSLFVDFPVKIGLVIILIIFRIFS
jgi:hypothetical protein